jgi:uncharacterized delta-60 repeat protein
MPRRHRLRLVVVLAALAAPLGAADGELDPGFHGDGRVELHPIPGAHFVSYRLVDAPDGALVSAGSTVVGTSQRASWSRVARTSADPASCNLEVAGASWSRYWAGTFDPAGRLVVAGEIDFTGQRQGVLAVYLYPACQLDASFGGGDGYVLAGALGSFRFLDVVAFRARFVFNNIPYFATRLVGVGTLGWSIGPESFENVMLVGYQEDGDLDADFGTDGLAIHDLADRISATALELAPGRELVVLAHVFEPSGPALLRLDEDGELLPHAGSHPGWTFLDLAPGTADRGRGYGLRVTPAGRIVIGGDSFDDTGSFGLVARRTLPDLAADATFDGDGVRQLRCIPGVDTDFTEVVVESDGSIVAGGEVATEPDSSLCAVRLTPSGALDPSFSGDGRAVFGAAVGSAGGVDHPGLALASGRAYLSSFDDDDGGLARILILGLANDLVFRDGFESGSTAAWSWDL